MTSRRHYEGLPSGALDKAKTLRRNATGAEKHLWRTLREKLPGVKFRRQVPHGTYVADFLCFDGKLIIEVDGATHAESIEQDAIRTRYFEAQGYHVLRFWNHDVMDNLDGVLTRISLSLPEREGGAKRREGEGEGPDHQTPSPSHA
jgi:very-short-patch-repair endonuclease